MTFQERAKLAMDALSKQPPVTLEQARAQVQCIKDRSKAKNRKGQAPLSSEGHFKLKK